MKKSIVLFLGFVFSFKLSATEIQGDFVVAKGNKIDLKTYSRIVILDPAMVETAYLIGAKQSIVAIATPSMASIYPKEETAKLPSVGTLFKPSLEQIIIQNPDLVILGYANEDLGKTLSEKGIAVIEFEVNKVADIFKNTEILGKLVNKQKEAQGLIKEKQAKLDIIKKAEPLNIKGDFFYSTNPIMAFAKGTLPYDILALYGVKSMTDNLTGRQPILSQEYIITQNPTFLIGIAGVRSAEGFLGTHSSLKNVDAIKNGHFFIGNSAQLLRGSPLLVDEIAILYDKLKQIKPSTKG